MPVTNTPNTDVREGTGTTNIDDLRPEGYDVAEADPGRATAGQADDVDNTLTTRDAEADQADNVDAEFTEGTAQGYDPTLGVVEDDMTSAHQLNRITSQDSANMRRAASQGMLSAGARGLGNSSFAAGAAQGAMVDRATPLAQQDASTYFQQGRANQDAQNRASEFNTGEANRMEGLNTQLRTETELANARAENEINMLNAQLQTAVSQGNAEEANQLQRRILELQTEVDVNNASLETQVSMGNADNETRVNLDNAARADAERAQVMQANQALNEQYLRGEQAMDLATIQGRYQQLISSNEMASRMYDSYFNSIAAAMANPDITPDRVAQYVQVQQAMLEAGLRMMDGMNNLDLGDFELPGAESAGTGKNSTIAPTPGSEGTVGTYDPNQAAPQVGTDEWNDYIAQMIGGLY